MKTEQRAQRRSSLLQAAAVCDVGSVQQHKEQGEASLKADVVSRYSGEGNLSPIAVTPDLRDDCDQELVQKEDEVTKLASSMSALKLIPPSVRFGRRRGRTGLSSS